MKYKVTAVIVCLITFALALHNIQYTPAPWFDEGWGLSLARNWVVLDHYGHLLLGEPVPSTILNTGFPAIAPIALSFQLLDIGVWQGRLPGVFFLIGVLLLTYHLAQRLYGPKIATWTIILSLLLPVHPELNPIFMGRQALGEVPALFYLLAGYSLLFAMWQKGFPAALTVPLFFGLALQTKPQLLPFWAASLLLPILWLVWQRKWIESRYLSISLILSIAFSFALSWIIRYWTNPVFAADSASGDPYAMAKNIDILLTYVIVLKPAFRIETLTTLLVATIGAATIIGVIYIGFKQITGIWQNKTTDAQSIWILILWIFVCSWLGWFFLLSIGFVRYLFPAFLIGSIFTAKTLYEVTLGFHPFTIIKTLAKSLQERRLTLHTTGLFLTVTFVIFWSIMTITLSYNLLFSHSDKEYVEVLTFLNQETAPTAIIETYDSELFLFLERDYHYPPDAVQHTLNRNLFLGENIPLDYDPRPLNIDYVVIGWTGMWPLYDNILLDQGFELVSRQV